MGNIKFISIMIFGAFIFSTAKVDASDLRRSPGIFKAPIDEVCQFLLEQNLVENYATGVDADVLYNEWRMAAGIRASVDFSPGYESYIMFRSNVTPCDIDHEIRHVLRNACGRYVGNSAGGAAKEEIGNILEQLSSCRSRARMTESEYQNLLRYLDKSCDTYANQMNGLEHQNSIESKLNSADFRWKKQFKRDPWEMGPCNMEKCNAKPVTVGSSISSTPPRPSNCINGPLLSGPPTLNSPAVTLANVQSRSGASRATRVGSASKKILQKVAPGACLDLKGLVKGACKSGLKGVVKSGPFVVCEIAVQAGTGYAVRSAGGNENQEEGACALASIGTGAALGGCVAGPPGAAVGAGVAGGVEAGIGVCKIRYYTISSFYNYGVCESVGSWLEEGYNPIDYWCGY